MCVAERAQEIFLGLMGRLLVSGTVQGYVFGPRTRVRHLSQHGPKKHSWAERALSTSGLIRKLCFKTKDALVICRSGPQANVPGPNEL